MTTNALERGRALIDELNPGFEKAIDATYRDVAPEFAETLIEFAYGRLYARPGLDLKTRRLAAVAALTVLGGHTAPQLKANIVNATSAGASQKEIAEVIIQMSVYGGMPATINALNSAKEVFAETAAGGD
ncbi:MAG: carboxymuconolactone decarboxylase family protein [Pseudomonadota bacterium]